MAAQHQHHIPPATSAQMEHGGSVLPLQMHYPQAQQQMMPQLGDQQPQLHYQQIQKQQLQQFWNQQMQEMEHVNDFKTHQLPLARIKKIMKSDEDVKNKRRTLQRNDIAGAITRGDIFDFLVDIVPRDELKDEDLGVPWTGVAGDPVQYGGMYYPTIPGQQMHHPMGPPEMMVGQPAIPANPQVIFQSPQAAFATEQQQQQ